MRTKFDIYVFIIRLYKSLTCNRTPMDTGFVFRG